MQIVWLLTVLGNLFLALTLIHRQHFIRYGWLTLSAVLAVLADAALSFIYRTSYYPPTIVTLRFLWLAVNGMVILEAFTLKNHLVQYVTEAVTVVEIFLLVAKKAGFLWTVYYVECGLRYANLAIIALLVISFSKEPFYELET
ncbi:MAG: hypothetical protein KGL39_30475 [Patescibacteria group bacterium]|nr:hypothetical protein [Patescibacteria group bacterium]